MITVTTLEGEDNGHGKCLKIWSVKVVKNLKVQSSIWTQSVCPLGSGCH